MLEALKPLIESDIVNDETRQAIQEAWEVKVKEITEQNKAEIREEFAQKYSHDKKVMVEAMDRMVTEALEAEISQIVKEKKNLEKDRVSYNKKMNEAMGKFDKFMVKKLTEEIKELHADRMKHKEALDKLEEFVLQALAEEIEEFQIDKKNLAKTKVKLVSEAKQKMARVQKEFIKKSAKLVDKAVTESLTREIKQLKEDISSARKNDFGRRLFEAFVSEYGNSFHNTNVEIKKLKKALEDQNKIVSESKNKIEKAQRLIESKERELRITKDRVQRDKLLSELLQPLNREKANAMRNLLENVETKRLRAAFDKYLPVLNEQTNKSSKNNLRVLNETNNVRKEETGNKKIKNSQESSDEELNKIRFLAGVK